MDVRQILTHATRSADAVKDALKVRDRKVLMSLLGPAVRGFVLQRGKSGRTTEVPAEFRALFNWDYAHDDPEMLRLYEAAKRSQWNGATDLDWGTDVDPFDEARYLVSDDILVLKHIPAFNRLDRRTQLEHKHALTAWMLSQFLHGEQGALFAACQVTQAVEWMDGKFYGSTQVMDEGRHVEVFHRYLVEKLGKKYQINDNLYVLIDALMSDSRWDIKFLGMQILIEGLALGAFGTLRQSSAEPLLRALLQYVITDEARHVHFGVVALGRYYLDDLSEAERREREDWAFEMSILLRNRFLGHEVFDEYYAHSMTRAEWDRAVLESDYMRTFRKTMFRRIVPNLKRIGLLTDRIRTHYEAIGLLEFEAGKAAPDLTVADLLEEA